MLFSATNFEHISDALVEYSAAFKISNLFLMWLTFTLRWILKTVRIKNQRLWIFWQKKSLEQQKNEENDLTLSVKLNEFFVVKSQERLKLKLMQNH